MGPIAPIDFDNFLLNFILKKWVFTHELKFLPTHSPHWPQCSILSLKYKRLEGQKYIPERLLNKIDFRHRESNPGLLGESQLSWPLDHAGLMSCTFLQQISISSVSFKEGESFIFWVRLRKFLNINTGYKLYEFILFYYYSQKKHFILRVVIKTCKSNSHVQDSL